MMINATWRQLCKLLFCATSESSMCSESGTMFFCAGRCSRSKWVPSFMLGTKYQGGPMDVSSECSTSLAYCYWEGGEGTYVQQE